MELMNAIYSIFHLSIYHQNKAEKILNNLMCAEDGKNVAGSFEHAKWGDTTTHSRQNHHHIHHRTKTYEFARYKKIINDCLFFFCRDGEIL